MAFHTLEMGKNTNIEKKIRKDGTNKNHGIKITLSSDAALEARADERKKQQRLKC